MNDKNYHSQFAQNLKRKKKNPLIFFIHFFHFSTEIESEESVIPADFTSEDLNLF